MLHFVNAQAANPAVLFLDEPTSGLDSRGALLVMRVIRRVAQLGRTVITTGKGKNDAVLVVVM